jgi:hypothetical protein
MALEHQVMVRLSADLHASALELAQSEDRTLSYFIRRAVKEDVERRAARNANPMPVRHQSVEMDARDNVKRYERSKVEPRFGSKIKKDGKK